MSPGTFLERRNMRPLETCCAFVDGYRLCFDIPVGSGERGVANLVADEAARTHGVGYLLTVEDAERLDRSEGVPNFYHRETVDLRFDDRAAVPGFTYRSTITVVGRKPSARYLDILLHGARTYGLPDAYITYLESLELAFDERIGAVRR